MKNFVVIMAATMLLTSTFSQLVKADQSLSKSDFYSCDIDTKVMLVAGILSEIHTTTPVLVEVPKDGGLLNTVVVKDSNGSPWLLSIQNGVEIDKNGVKSPIRALHFTMDPNEVHRNMMFGLESTADQTSTKLEALANIAAYGIYESINCTKLN